MGVNSTVGVDLHKLEAGAREEALKAAAGGVNNLALKQAVDSLETIRKLLDAERDDKVRRRKFKFGVAAIAAVIVLAILSLTPVRSADINAQVATVGATLRSNAAQPLTGLLPLRELVLLQTARITLPSEFGTWQTGADLRLTTLNQPIVMEPIEIAAGDRVSIEQLSPRRFRLTLEAARAIELAFSLVGEVTGVSDAGSRTATFKSPRQLTAGWNGGESISLTFSTDAHNLTQPITVDDVRLVRVDANGRLRRTVSTVLGGDLAFPAYLDKVHALRPGENLALSGFEGEVSAIAVRDEALAFTIAGAAGNVETGPTSQRRSLSPNLLESAVASVGWNSVWIALGALMALGGALWPIWTSVR